MLTNNTENVIISLLFGLIFYVALEITLHNICKNETTKIERKLPYHAFISIGYFIKDCYKGSSINKVRHDFIVACNFWNCIISLVFLIISLVISFSKPDYLIYLVGFNFWRFYSRNFEIILAFGFDVINKEPARTGDYFDKIDRLKLAVISYFEIYLYSASFYATLPINFDNAFVGLKAILMSLSVGTLTNVAYAQEQLFSTKCDINNFYLLLQLIPFAQVIATLSLVVLSLTIYISRTSELKTKEHPWTSL